MPDKIEHIEVAIGTYPSIREGKTASEKIRLIFVETVNGSGSDKHEFYTKYDTTTIGDLTDAMINNKNVTFTEKAEKKNDREIADRGNSGKTRKPIFVRFEGYTIS